AVERPSSANPRTGAAAPPSARARESPVGTVGEGRRRGGVIGEMPWVDLRGGILDEAGGSRAVGRVERSAPRGRRVVGSRAAGRLVAGSVHLGLRTGDVPGCRCLRWGPLRWADRCAAYWKAHRASRSPGTTGADFSAEAAGCAIPDAGISLESAPAGSRGEMYASGNVMAEETTFADFLRRIRDGDEAAAAELVRRY